jgi:lipid-binding SYLF domain-containing protein
VRIEARTACFWNVERREVFVMRQKFLFGAIAWLVAIGTAAAAISTAETKRLQNAASVVQALRDQPDRGIPDALWQRATCVAVIPDMKKAAFGIGGEYGRGVMSCRNGEGWGAPVFMQLAKGSWGFQIGASEIDLVLLVMNREGAEKLMNDKVSLGADASIAAGPVGRGATAATDAQLSAEILSYSRARGAFAGIDISGGVLGPDKDANSDVFKPDVDPKQIAFGNVAAPREAAPLLKALGRQTVATTGK